MLWQDSSQTLFESKKFSPTHFRLFWCLIYTTFQLLILCIICFLLVNLRSHVSPFTLATHCGMCLKIYICGCPLLSKQEVVPSYLATSPILSDGAALMASSLMGKKSSGGPPIQTLGSAGSTGEAGCMTMMMKKRRKRRRKARADSLKREESGEYSEDEDVFTIDISSDEGAEMENSR